MSVGGGLLFAAALMAPVTTAVSWKHEARVVEAIVRLGDVADLSNLPPSVRAAAAALPVAWAPAGDQIVLRARDIQARARQQMPLLGPLLTADDLVVTVKRPAATAPAEPEKLCARLSRAVKGDEILTREDFAAAPCGDLVLRAVAWRYDTAIHALRVTRELAANEVLAAPPAGLLALVRPDQPLRFTTRAGAVVVERQVQAVRPARPGEATFVRAADGAVFAVTAEEIGQ